MFRNIHKEMAQKVALDMKLPYDVVKDILDYYYGEVRLRIMEMDHCEVEVKNLLIFRADETKAILKLNRYNQFLKTQSVQKSTRAIELTGIINNRIQCLEKVIWWCRLKDILKRYRIYKIEKQKLKEHDEFIENLEKQEKNY